MTLLGTNYERIVKKEKIYRVFSSFIFLLSLVVVIGMIFMLPSYFTVVFSKDDILRRLKSAEEILARRDSDKLEEETRRINTVIANYQNNEKKRRSFSGLLVSIFRITPPEIKIENIGFLKDKEGKFTFTVFGTASTRDDFISYVSGLQKLPILEQVKSPISNLLEESNASFKLELKIKPEAYKL